MQFIQATECAVTYIVFDKTNGARSFDSAAKVIASSSCDNNKTNIDGNKKLLLCVATTAQMKDPCDKNQVMFLMCKNSGLWTVFGHSKFCNDASSKDKDFSYTYYLDVLPYLKWIKKTIAKHDTKMSQSKLKL